MRPTLGATGLLLLLLLLLRPLSGFCEERGWIAIDDLEGVRVSAAIAVDRTREAGLAQMKREGMFAPVTGSIRERGGHDPIWLRLTVDAPAHLLGRSAWLEIRPAHLWDLRLHTGDGVEQVAGFGVAVPDRSQSGTVSRFRVRLDEPRVVLHLRVVATGTELIHLTLRSDASMRDASALESWLQGFFFGAAALMLIVTLLNWAWTGDPLYRGYAAYLAASTIFLLFLSGYVTAYILTDTPRESGILVTLAGAVMLAEGIWFGILLMQLDLRQPRIAWALRWLARGVLIVGAVSLADGAIHAVTQVLLPVQFLSGVVLLGLSGWQAWTLRTRQACLLFMTYLVFTLLDKGPVLTVFGVIPVRTWTVDLLKAGVMVQMLLVHVLLVTRAREQQRERVRAERDAALERAQAEAEREQRIELSQFLTMFGHEVRTPLAVIDSTTQSLELLPGAAQPDFALRHERIRAAVRRLDRLAGVALARERVEAGELRPDARYVPLENVVDEAISVHGFSLAEIVSAPRGAMRWPEGAARTGALEVSLPIRAIESMIDPALMQLALENLLDNAVKYSNPHSPVRVAVERLDAAADPARPRARARISVDSQGPELSGEDLERAFDKYWRRDEHTDLEGAGLGLYLVRRIARAHGGEAWAASLGDGWTRFAIDLPHEGLSA